MNQLKTILLALVGALTIVACKNEQGKISVDESHNWKNLETKLDSLFTKNFSDDEPGVAVLVAYNGNKIFGKGYGVRNIKTQEPITASSNLEIASITKQFTALAILKLVEENKISLSDTIYNFFPYETFKNITILQLVNHTSGLDDAEDYLYNHWNSAKIATNQDILTWYIKKNKRVLESDKVFKYNNGAYELLPLIIEKVSGKTYPEFIKKNIFDKAGMTRTIVYNLNNPTNIEERAFYYSKDSLGQWKKMDGHPLTGILGSGGIYTNLNDYLSYDNALSDESILGKATRKLIFKPTSTEIFNGVEYDYAMGWFVTDSVAEHTGGWDGVNTLTRKYLNKPLTLTFLANTDDFLRKSIVELTDSIVKTEIKTTIANNGYK